MPLPLQKHVLHLHLHTITGYDVSPQRPTRHNSTSIPTPERMSPRTESHSHHITLLTLLIVTLFLIPGLPQYLIKLPFLPFLPSSPPPIAYPPNYPTPPLSSSPNMSSSWSQTTLPLPAHPRGCHLITKHITTSLPAIQSYRVGLLHLFLQHTSCALALNENYDPDVRRDMSDALDRIAPEDGTGKLYRHNDEGPDDMPAHVKSALIGASVSVPIADGKLALGTWQGIWLLEFRDGRHARRVVATMQGEKKA